MNRIQEPKLFLFTYCTHRTFSPDSMARLSNPNPGLTVSCQVLCSCSHHIILPLKEQLFFFFWDFGVVTKGGQNQLFEIHKLSWCLIIVLLSHVSLTGWATKPELVLMMIRNWNKANFSKRPALTTLIFEHKLLLLEQKDKYCIFHDSVPNVIQMCLGVY